MRAFLLLLALCGTLAAQGNQRQMLLANVNVAASGHTATRVNFKHQYSATSGTGISLGFAVSAGDLLVIQMAGGSGTLGTDTVSDSINGSWTCLSSQTYNSGKHIQLCYFLSSGAGTPTVTPTYAGVGDFGWTVIAYHQTAGSWSLDSSLTSGSFKDGSTVSTTTTPTTDTWSTGGSYDVIIGTYGEESTSLTVLTAGTNFTLVQADTNHNDAQEEWIGATAQTNQTASFTQSPTNATWGLYLAAFTLS